MQPDSRAPILSCCCLFLSFLVRLAAVYSLPLSLIDLSSSGSVEFHWGTFGMVGIPARVYAWVSGGRVSPSPSTHYHAGQPLLGLTHFQGRQCISTAALCSANLSVSMISPLLAPKLTWTWRAWQDRLRARVGRGRNSEYCLPQLFSSPCHCMRKYDSHACHVEANYSLFSLVSAGTRSVPAQPPISSGLPLACRCTLELMRCKSPGMICVAAFN